MPHAILQLEQRLEPFVKRFDCLAAPAVNGFAPAAAVERPPCQALAVRLVSRLNGLLAGFAFRSAFVLGTEESPTRGLSFLSPFDALGQVIAVIPAISRNMLGRLGKIVDFVESKVCVSLPLAVPVDAKRGKTVAPFVAETTTSKL